MSLQPCRQLHGASTVLGEHHSCHENCSTLIYTNLGLFLKWCEQCYNEGTVKSIISTLNSFTYCVVLSIYLHHCPLYCLYHHCCLPCRLLWFHLGYYLLDLPVVEGVRKPNKDYQINRTLNSITKNEYMITKRIAILLVILWKVCWFDI